jgi:hypothetical protein
MMTRGYPPPLRSTANNAEAADLARPGAMDSAIRGMNTSNFLKRWPDAARISLSGTGR